MKSPYVSSITKPHLIKGLLTPIANSPDRLQIIKEVEGDFSMNYLAAIKGVSNK